MISSSIIAKQRRCLRHQLREALWKSWLNSYSQTPQNAFFTRAARFQEEASQVIVETKPATLETDEGPIAVKPGLVVRKVDPGRIVGKGARRQAVVSRRITRDSLDKPSYVLVFRDVDGNETARPVEDVAGATAGAAQDIITSPLMPTPDETIASIDALKPPTSPLLTDKAEYKRLMDTLLMGYNTVQLRDYLIHCFARLKSFPSHVSGSGSVDDDIESQRIGKWQAGQTPLEQRSKPTVEKKPKAYVKKRMAENILRLAWQVIVTSDQAKVGEIELAVKPWELQLLFDMEMNGKPSFHSLLSSEILVQNSEIRPYRPDNIVRITARRQDAEDIARQLRRALFSVSCLELDLKIFSPLLGQHGWPLRLEELFRDDDLKFVSDTSGALINRADDNVLVVYAFNASAENDAQRLLLAHLKKPTPTSHNQIIDVAQTMTDDKGDKTISSKLIAIPCTPESDRLNRGYRHNNLVRMVKPVARREPNAADQARTTAAPELDDEGSAARDKFAEFIGQQLGAVESYSGASKDVPNHPGSYWGKSVRLRPQNWRAHLCKLLNSADEEQVARSEAGQVASLIPVYEVPGVERLVSYFDNRQKVLVQRYRKGVQTRNVYEGKRYFEKKIDASLPNLVACFVPSPFTEAGAEIMTRLPTIELRFGLSDASKRPTHDGDYEDRDSVRERRSELRLQGVRAVLDQQFVSIPLADEAVDVLFSRPTMMFADQKAILANTDVASFIQQLREVFLADGKLSSATEMPFFLPGWLVQGEMPSENSAEEPDVPILYLFDRFEQIQAFNLELADNPRNLDGLDPQDRTVLERIPKEVHLELRQVEGSIIHGKETSLNVRLEQGSRVEASKELKTGEDQEGMEEQSVASPPGNVHSDAPTDLAQTSTDEPKTLLKTLARTTLDVAHLLTRANAGAIPMIQVIPPKTTPQDVGISTSGAFGRLRADPGEARSARNVSKSVRAAFGHLESDPDDAFSARNVTKGDTVDAAERNRQATPELFELPFDTEGELAGSVSDATSTDEQSTSLDEKSEDVGGDTEAARTTAKPRRNLFHAD